MNQQRRNFLIATVLLSLSSVARAAADKSAQGPIYRALFSYFVSKATESPHLFIAEEPAQSEEVLRANSPEMSRSKRLQALVPGTTESLRNQFLRILESRHPIDARDLSFEGGLKITTVSRDEPEAIFKNWGQFRDRFPGAQGLVRLSHAATDDDMQTALVYAGYWCGGTCGGGYLFLLANLKNGWRVVHDQVLWVA